MTNPKIERVKEDIIKTKAKISEYTGKLRELERYKIDLENLDIIALYRKENFNEDEFAALLRSQRNAEMPAGEEKWPVSQRGKRTAPVQEIKEDNDVETDEI